jgi:beta-lactamase class A
MYYNTRQIGRSRYSAVFPGQQKSNTYSAVEAAVYRWPTKHAVALLSAIALLLFAAMSGIFLRASQLASYTPPTSPKQQPAQTVSVPAIQELAGTEPTPPLAVSTADAGLQTILDNWVANHPSVDWSISVSGLGDDGRFAGYNPDKKRGLASIYKLFLMYPLYQKVPLDQFASTTINTDSSSHSLADCVNAMMLYSDNECGVAVGRYVGWTNADNTLNKLGFSQTELYSDNGTESSAGDTTKLLKELYAGSMFSDAQRQFIINILKVQTKRSGIPAGCSGCTVANKTGSLSYVNNDAGIIYYADSNYVLSVFTDGAGFDSIAALTAQVQSYMSTR